MEAGAVGADLGEHPDGFDGRGVGADGVAEGVSAALPTVHKPKVELCSGRGLKVSCVTRKPHFRVKKFSERANAIRRGERPSPLLRADR